MLVPGASPRTLLPSRLLPIAQTAGAAVIAYYLAQLLPLHEQRPVFASIAAVISLGATYERRGPRALELIGGVVLGLTVADLIVQAVGTGPLQIALMVTLAMGVAVVLGGGELLVTEAAVSGLLLSALGSTSHGLSVDRFLEALTGGAVALAVGYLVFPPDPAALVRRAAHALFRDLGATVEQLARSLAGADPACAGAALRDARELDTRVHALADALETARETARFAPLRRGTVAALAGYGRTLRQLDFAVRNTRVLARHSLRYSRARLHAPDGLPEALHDLAGAVAALAAACEDHERTGEVSRLALAAAVRARAVFEQEPDLELTAILTQVRSLAADLLRAAELLDGAADTADEPPTEELLDAVVPATA
jgi:uncharacterized membrane protein YgaE (UPF0421/DUF939 family)